MRLKKLELAGKRVATGAIAALMKKGGPDASPDWRARPHRVLFLRHDRIGDMILSTGTLRAIARSHPTLKLDVLASYWNSTVIRDEPYLNEIIAFDRRNPREFPRLFRELRARRYDAVIDCMITAPSLTTLLLMLASGAPHRIGVAAHGNDFAYTLPVPARDSAEHIADKIGTLVSAFGVDPDDVDLSPRITLTAAEREAGESYWRAGVAQPRGSRLLVNVSAGRAHHAWPDDRFVAVLQEANRMATDADVIVVSTPSDRERARAIANAGGARLVEDKGIRDAMAIVAACDLVFTPDTSISHVASAFEKPAVVLHPRGFGALWGPYGTEGVTVESATDSVADITAAVAVEALRQTLASLSAR